MDASSLTTSRSIATSGPLIAQSCILRLVGRPSRFCTATPAEAVYTPSRPHTVVAPSADRPGGCPQSRRNASCAGGPVWHSSIITGAAHWLYAAQSHLRLRGLVGDALATNTRADRSQSGAPTQPSSPAEEKPRHHPFVICLQQNVSLSGNSCAISSANDTLGSM